MFGRRSPVNASRARALPVAGLMLVLALVLAACQPAAGPAPAATEVLGSTRVPAPTAAPAMATPTGPAKVMVATDAKLGKILVGDKGMTLYLFTKDTNGTSVCYDKCAQVWPPLLTNGAPVAGDGVTAAMLGVTARKDGSQQVTYGGMPLYYYTPDKQPGDTTGQGVGNVWFVVPPSGPASTGSATPAPAATAAMTPTMAAPANVMLNTSTTDALGTFLVDGRGMTLYFFDKDSAGASNCNDKCAQAWPPLLIAGGNTPTAGANVTGKLGVMSRKDGTSQVTYNGWPLYYFAKDQKTGDAAGQGIGKIWYVMPPAGGLMAPAATVALNLGSTTALGKFLVDAQGMTLYYYTKDSADLSNCYDKCAQAWPPLLIVSGQTPTADAAATGKVNVIQRKDGTYQVTYNGWPLYYFVKDQKAGDTNGQGIGSVWFVAPPTGGPMPAPAPAATTAAGASQSGYGGYAQP